MIACEPAYLASVYHTRHGGMNEHKKGTIQHQTEEEALCIWDGG